MKPHELRRVRDMVLELFLIHLKLKKTSPSRCGEYVIEYGEILTKLGRERWRKDLEMEIVEYAKKKMGVTITPSDVTQSFHIDVSQTDFSIDKDFIFIGHRSFKYQPEGKAHDTYQ